MNAPVVLVVGHVLPVPPAAGNEIRILKMAQWLRGRGYRVVMLYNHEPVSDERRRELELATGPVHFVGEVDDPPPARSVPSLPVALARVLPDSRAYRWMFGMRKPKKIQSDEAKAFLGSARLVQSTRRLCATYRPVAVIAQYIFAAPCLDAAPPGVLKMIDTHDMFSRKAAEVVAFGVEDPLVCTPRDERRYLLKSDVIIAIQTHEARLFRALVPEAVLRVVGKLARHLRTSDERVRAVGWVPDLDAEYRRAAVVINPTKAGTGLKIKSVEALCRGKALVGTPNGVDGIEAAGEVPYLVGADWTAFARAVNELLGSRESRRRLEQAATRFAREAFSPERTYAPLDANLQAAVRSPEQ